MFRKVLALGIFCTVAFAQAQDPPSAAVPQAPTVSPEMKKLDWIVGDWSGDMNWTGPGNPGTGAYTSHITRQGQFLHFDSTVNMGAVPYTESSYLGYDPKSKKYVMYSFTNMSPVPRIERGDFTSDSIFASTSDPWDMGSGTPMTSRSTITKKSADEVTLLIEGNVSGQWSKLGEVTLKRKTQKQTSR